MKSFHKINTWALVINVLLFIVPFIGLLAMILLGLLQLFIAARICRLYYNKLDKERRVLLNRYWLMVAADFVLMAISLYFGEYIARDTSCILFLFLLPGFIALYFAYTTYSITKYFNTLA